MSSDPFSSYRTLIPDTVSATWIAEEPKGKNYTVIRAKDRLGVRRLTVKGKSELGSWDLCAISLPNHPSFNDKNVVEQLEGTYVALSFESENLRDSFNETLRKLLKLRAGQEKIFQQGRDRAKMMGTAVRHTVVR